MWLLMVSIGREVVMRVMEMKGETVNGLNFVVVVVRISSDRAASKIRAAMADSASMTQPRVVFRVNVKSIDR